ncbi:MAG TPA: LPS export ABC transporter periplasmic protein LptC [Longimicrobium sp.]|nr:LPS export ABC transporter periplasmic protein LptC [Longimicrobium sp.]
MTRFTGSLTLALAAALASACARGPSAPTTGQIEADASQVTYAMNMKLSEEGVLKADLNADTAITRVGETRTELKGVKLTFFNPGRPPGKLTSTGGEYDQASGAMIARGHVVLIVPGEKGMRTIRSEELHWDQKGDRVWSTVATSIEEGGKILYTQGFNSNSAFTNVTGTNAHSNQVPVGSGGVTF